MEIRIKRKGTFLEGHKPTNETRLKLSIAGRNRKISPITREKIRIAALKRKHSLKTREKIRQANLGEKSPRWKGGIYKKGHSTKEPKYKAWRTEVFSRDNFKCKLLNNECSGKLEAHHLFNWVDYPELRYIINNGITLCHFHHPLGRKKEKQMIPIFQELLLVSEENYAK